MSEIGDVKALNRPASSPVRRVLISLGLLLSLASVSPETRAQDYGFPLIESYLSRDLGVNVANDGFSQESSGALWAGYNVLSRFDGIHWKQFNLGSMRMISGLDFDRKDRLWIAGANDVGWLEKAPDLEWRFHSLQSKLDDLHVPWGAAVWVYAEENAVVFVTNEVIVRWNGSKFVSWPMPGTRRLFPMRSAGTVYVHYVKEGIYAMREQGPELVIPQSALGNQVVLWLERRESDWLLAASGGIFLYRNGVLEPFAPDVSAFLQRNILVCGTRLHDGRYVFAAIGGGLAIMRPDGTLDRVVREEDGLPSNQITALFVDREGNLWVGAGAGVCRIDVGLESIFDERAGLPRRDYPYWAATPSGPAVASPESIYLLASDHRSFRPIESIPGAVEDITNSSAGLLVPGWHGLRVWRQGKISQPYTSVHDIWGAFPSRLAPTRTLLTDYRDVVALEADGTSRVLVHALPDNPLTVAEDDAENLWIGTMTRGVMTAHVQSDVAVQAQPIASSFGLPTLIGETRVRATSDGSILVFADNGGWFKPRGATRFAAIENYQPHKIGNVSFASNDDTWWIAYADENGRAPFVARVRVEGARAVWQPHSIPGLNVIGPPRGILAERGENGSTVLWVGGLKSVMRHVVTNGPIVPVPSTPVLQVRAQSAGDDALRPITTALPYSTRAIQFEFAELEFSRRALLRLETRIDGIDRDWMPAPADGRRELTAVRDGRYAFHVRAVAENGVAGETATFAFEVLPPWWRTTPALFAGLFALVPLGYSGYRLRVRALRRRNRELEAKVRERTEALEQASAAKTEFVANMSHDIRNPLNGIVGLALALEDTRLDPRQREIVATLRECTMYLSTLVDDVLDFASIEAGRVELRPGPFVPEELLRSIVTSLKGDTAVSGATLRVEVGPTLPARLVGDAGRIQQILVNYVSNALKYAGGEILVSASAAADAPDEVEFSVTDNGPGITPAEQASLFTKFTRLAAARRDEIQGAGLGLASCRLLADIMGGSVGVASAPGRGARFFLRLPLAVATTELEPATAELPHTTVLLVEDTDYNALAATAVLRRLGLSCERARTGAEALELFAAKRFNLVLLDRNLPDMDGTEVARKMRAMETDGLPSILLAVTAYCTAEDRQLCLDAGMDAFVGKPLTPDKLRKVLLAAGRRLLAAATLNTAPEATVSRRGLDPSMLNYLSDGSEGGLREQTERFVLGLAESESRLARQFDARDFSALAHSAHELLASARMIGAEALTEAAQQLEKSARAGDCEACARLLAVVRAETESVTEALRHRRSAELTT